MTLIPEERDDLDEIERLNAVLNDIEDEINLHGHCPNSLNRVMKFIEPYKDAARENEAMRKVAEAGRAMDEFMEIVSCMCGQSYQAEVLRAALAAYDAIAKDGAANG